MKNTQQAYLPMDKVQELYNYIEGVTLGTKHQYSPHTQDLLRYLKNFHASNVPLLEFDTDFMGISDKSTVLFDDEVNQLRLNLGHYWANRFKNTPCGTRFRILIIRHQPPSK